WQPNPTGFPIAGVPRLLDEIRRFPAFAGKEDGFDVCWIGTTGDDAIPRFADASERQLADARDRLLELYGHYRKYAVTTLRVPTPRTGSVDEYLDYLRWFARDVVPEVG